MAVFNLIAGIASIVGFWFSLWAWVQAKSASKAARSAREAVLVRNLVEDLQLLCSKMDDLLDLIEHERMDEAGWVAREVACALSEIPHRGSPYLAEAERNAILSQRTQAEIIEQQISATKGEPVTGKRKDRLARVCRNSSDALRRVLGKMKGELESRGTP